MSLANLLKTGQLKEHPVDADEIERLLAAAARGLVDARVATISPETRFDAAYRSITLADYTGADIDDASVAACIDAAVRLLADARNRLAGSR